jgi:hypothetical protein
MNLLEVSEHHLLKIITNNKKYLALWL